MVPHAPPYGTGGGWKLDLDGAQKEKKNGGRVYWSNWVAE